MEPFRGHDEVMRVLLLLLLSGDEVDGRKGHEVL